MEERKCGYKAECDYKIIAFVDGKRIVIECNKETECLSKLVWSGKGVKKAAAKLLGHENTVGIEACVDGECLTGKI